VTGNEGGKTIFFLLLTFAAEMRGNERKQTREGRWMLFSFSHVCWQKADSKAMSDKCSQAVEIKNYCRTMNAEGTWKLSCICFAVGK